MKTNNSFFKTFFFYLLILGFIFSCKTKKDKTNSNISNSNAKVNLRFSHSQIQLANIHTDSVKRSSISEGVNFNGKIILNENLNKVFSSKVSGRIVNLHVKTTGSLVKSGDVLYEIYSEELLSAQQEYLNLVQQINKNELSSDYSAILKATENRLFLFGLNKEQISSIRNSKQIENPIKIYCNETTLINNVLVKEGDYVSEGTPIFNLNSGKSVWVEGLAFPEEAAYLVQGNNIEIEFDAHPSKIFKSKIDFINPEKKENSVAIIFRSELVNLNNEFLPGMFAEIRVKIHEKKAITLPVDAVIQNANEKIIWIQNHDGSFESRKVTTGIQTANKIEITSGLAENEVAVISGAYLINSENILKNISAEPIATK